eukprot:5601297-Prymnesium_polylepis.1
MAIDPYSTELDEFERNVLLHHPVVVLDRRGRVGGVGDHAIEPAVMLSYVSQRAQHTHTHMRPRLALAYHNAFIDAILPVEARCLARTRAP